MDDERVDHDELPRETDGDDGTPPPQPEPAPSSGDGVQPESSTGERPSAECEAEPIALVSTSPWRGLKLVVTLQPHDGPGYRALLAVGADGCDPLLRSAEVADLRAALDELPALLAEAEARWQAQPRNSAAQPASSTGPAAPSRPARPKSARPPAVATALKSASTADGDAPATPASGGQLSFFG